MMDTNIVKGKPLGPASPISSHPISPRRVFRHVNYPKRITKQAASYLHNIQTLLAAYVPWVSHVHLCVYHIWALIWALSRAWRSHIWHALLWLRCVFYSIIRQHCFVLNWYRERLRSHNWRGPALHWTSYRL